MTTINEDFHQYLNCIFQCSEIIEADELCIPVLETFDIKTVTRAWSIFRKFEYSWPMMGQPDPIALAKSPPIAEEYPVYGFLTSRFKRLIELSNSEYPVIMSIFKGDGQQFNVALLPLTAQEKFKSPNKVEICKMIKSYQHAQNFCSKIPNSITVYFQRGYATRDEYIAALTISGERFSQNIPTSLDLLNLVQTLSILEIDFDKVVQECRDKQPSDKLLMENIPDTTPSEP